MVCLKTLENQLIPPNNEKCRDANIVTNNNKTVDIPFHGPTRGKHLPITFPSFCTARVGSRTDRQKRLGIPDTESPLMPRTKILYPMKSPSVRVMCRIKVTKFYLPLTSVQKILEEPKKEKKKRIWEPEGQKNKKRRDRNITVKRLTRTRTSWDGGRPRTQ